MAEKCNELKIQIYFNKLLIIKKIVKYSFNFNNSTTIININKLNDKIIIIILIIITIIIILIITQKKINKSTIENQKIETIWTIFPIVIISIISFISIPILYLNQEVKIPILTIKATRNQWFWRYEYINTKVNFNSYIFYKKKFHFNIIETDNKIVIPFNVKTNVISSSIDVIHSWAIPTINIKSDAIPGQINTNNFRPNKIGVSFGQCSEICGVKHSFIPIIIEIVTLKEFSKWLNEYKFLGNLNKKY